MPDDNVLQLAYGGVTKEDGQEIFQGSLSWKQPGLTSVTPIEFSIGVDDVLTAHVLLRDVTGSTINTVDYEINAFDETTADTLPVTLSKVSSGEDFYTASHDTIRIDISLSGYGQTVRVVNLSVEDLSSYEIIQARLKVTGASEPFGYISFSSTDRGSRQKISSYSRELVLEASAGGNAILISPGAAFQEVDPVKDVYHFSYPLGQLFYYLEQDENLEEFDFVLSATSHLELADVIKTYSLGSNRRVGVIEIDGYLPRATSDLSGLIYADIKATGNVSSSEHVFRIYFNKGFKKNQLLQP